MMQHYALQKSHLVSWAVILKVINSDTVVQTIVDDSALYVLYLIYLLSAANIDDDLFLYYNILNYNTM